MPFAPRMAGRTAGDVAHAAVFSLSPLSLSLSLSPSLSTMTMISPSPQKTISLSVCSQGRPRRRPPSSLISFPVLPSSSATCSIPFFFSFLQYLVHERAGTASTYAPYLRAPLVFDDDDDDGDGDGKQERENSTFCAKSWGNYQEGLATRH